MSVRRDERGPVVAVRGAQSDWIAKFPSSGFPRLPHVEHATMEWARACGLNVPRCECSVEPILGLPDGFAQAGEEYFLIERFDRMPGERRVHQEDFAQILDRPLDQRIYDGRHEHIAAVLAAVAPVDLRDYVERVVFTVLCGNGDAHLKNWALRYEDGRNARLSPVYDVVSTVVYSPRVVDDQLALSLGGSRRFEDASVKAFEPLAEAAGLSFDEVRAIITSFAERVRAVWHERRADLPYSDDERTRIEQHLARVPLP